MEILRWQDVFLGGEYKRLVLGKAVDSRSLWNVGSLT